MRGQLPQNIEDDDVVRVRNEKRIFLISEWWWWWLMMTEWRSEFWLAWWSKSFLLLHLVIRDDELALLFSLLLWASSLARCETLLLVVVSRKERRLLRERDYIHTSYLVLCQCYDLEENVSESVDHLFTMEPSWIRASGGAVMVEGAARRAVDDTTPQALNQGLDTFRAPWHFEG